MDIVFRFDTDASPETILEAVKTSDGIKGFWTSRADVPSEVGETLKLEFPVAPLPFDLKLEQSDDHTVVWRTETFPPHWVGTTVTFRHAGFPDDDETGRVAYTWGQIMIQLKEYAETGKPEPVFA